MSKFSFFEVSDDFDDKVKKSKEAKDVWDKNNHKKKTYASETALKITDQSFDFEKEKKSVIDNLNSLKLFSVEEFTFLKKFEEIKLCDDALMEYARQCKGSIWSPTNLDDEELTIKELSEISPKIVIVKTPEQEKLWYALRIFCHTAEYNQAPGRLIKFFLVDGNNEDKILGFSSIASEVISISCRDEYLGWTLNNRLVDGKLNHSAICTTIAATQPFGSNFLGGKLLAAMMTTDVVRNAWLHDYNSELVGVTTTSLYGSFSMYNSLKWWKPVGKSKGKIPIKMKEEYYEKWHNEYIKRYKLKEYNEKMIQKEGVSGPVTGAKMRVLSMIFECLGVKQSDYAHGFERGVYYSCFYENTKEFLSGKIEKDKLVMKPLFKGNVNFVVDWWKPKAIERYKKLKLENRLYNDKLFYSDMKDMTYDEAKTKYLDKVGN